jgi:hypothetical protein
MTTDKIKITMSERRPLSIDKEAWPIIAKANWWNGEHKFQANYERWIRVREHADGRRVVYGAYTSGNGGVPVGFRGAEGGFLVPARDGVPDDDGTVRAIRRIGGIIDDDKLADECIANLPAEPVEDEDGTGGGVAMSTEKFAKLMSLLVLARPHCPADLQAEIYAALQEGA